VANNPTFSGVAVDAGLIEDLVAASRILALYKVLDGWGHVSIRHPGNPQRYLLSRARAPALVTADDIMEFDLESNPIDQQGRRIFVERFIHGSAYKARPDVNAVVHSHSPTVIPFTVTGEPLKALTHIASFLCDEPPVWEIRDVGITQGLLVTNNEQGSSLCKMLGHRPVALMRGHGNIVVPALRAPRALHRDQRPAARDRAVVQAPDHLHLAGRGAGPQAARRFLGCLEARGNEGLSELR
jgi:HCOMODA/2-hydroxy-3-carboxy-muconic semialdehyde decarboxylase